MLRVSLAILTVSLLSACLGQPPIATPTLASEAAQETVAPTSMPRPSVAVAFTSSPGTHTSEYKDTWLCFAVEVPEGWFIDGVPGGLASFAPATGQASFRITNVALEETTLAQALAEVQQGSLGTRIQEVTDFVVDDQPALWVTFAPNTEFQFAVLVIAPDCGDGSHALLISVAGADRKSFEVFLNSVRFIR